MARERPIVAPSTDRPRSGHVVLPPLLTNWTKLGTIVNNTLAGPLGVSGSDPSSAWRTPAGEWRLTTAGGMITGSMDFVEWYQIGIQVRDAIVIVLLFLS